MNRHRPAGFALGLLMIVAGSAENAARAQCTWQWHGLNPFGSPGGPVHSLLAANLDGVEMLYGGGSFSVPGAGTTFGVFATDGKDFSYLGVANDVKAIVLHDGALVAAGAFVPQQGAPFRGVARWQNGDWQPLGIVEQGNPMRLASFAGRLIVSLDAGTATIDGVVTNRVAAWDGTHWASLGAGVNGRINAFMVWNGRLYVGGDFTAAGGQSAAHLASWDGSAWSDVGGGVSGAINGMCAYENQLIVGGRFLYAGSGSDWAPARNIARWDGAHWSELGESLNEAVQSLVEYDGALYANTTTDRRTNRWQDGTWQIVATQHYGSIESMCAFRGELVGGGESFQNSDTGLKYLGALRGDQWAPIWKGTYVPSRLVVSDGRLYGFQDRNIARFDPGGWTNLPSFTSQSDFNVYGLTTYSNALIAYGHIRSDADSRQHLARFDGDAWTLLPGGFDGSFGSAAVYCGELYVSGSFTRVDSVVANQLARWDGVQWRRVAAGPFSSGPDSYVSRLIVFRGELVVSGSFTHIDDVPLAHIASWNGTRWAPLGEGTNSSTAWLHVHADELIVGGDFTSAGGQPIRRIARWDGNVWSGFGPGDFYTIGAASIGDDLYIAGNGEIPNAPGRRIAHWDGASLIPIDGEFSFTQGPASIAAYGGELYVTGNFIGWSAPPYSPNLLRYSPDCPPGDCDCDGHVTLFHIDPFIYALTDPLAHDYLFPTCALSNCDVDADGKLTNFDIDPFVACVIQSGCD